MTQDNTPDRKAVLDQYARLAGEYDSRWSFYVHATTRETISRLSVHASDDVLDVGCGLADFYAWLGEQGIKVDYTGYDITPEFIDLAAARFPEAKFEVRDIQTQGIPGRFDFIISSQTFNNRLAHENNLQLMKDVLRICYEACDQGVAVDMMTAYVDFQEERLFYYQPEEIFRHAKSLTKRVTLRHDYPAFEFAIFLYKDFTGWKK